MRHLNHGGETPNKALNKIVNKDKQPVNKAKQIIATSEQSSKSKDQSMKANQNIIMLL